MDELELNEYVGRNVILTLQGGNVLSGTLHHNEYGSGHSIDPHFIGLDTWAVPAFSVLEVELNNA